MTDRDLVKIEIDTLPDDMINFVREFVGFLKNYKIVVNVDSSPKTDEIQESYKNLLKFKGTLKGDIDIKKEKLEALDEKYNNFS